MRAVAQGKTHIQGRQGHCWVLDGEHQIQRGLLEARKPKFDGAKEVCETEQDVTAQWVVLQCKPSTQLHSWVEG